MIIKLSDSYYNTIKWLTTVFLPAISVFYVGVADIYDLPLPGEISSTIMALIVFLGVFLQINSISFKLNLVQEKGITALGNMKLRFIMSNQMYDVLKWISTILLPAIAVLYVALSSIWNLPYGETVSGSITAFVLLMATLLKISALEYKTSMVVVNSNEAPAYTVVKGFFAMPSETYDTFKFISQGLLPAFATFYITLSVIWSLPYGEQVSATTMAVVLFINAILQISTLKHNANNTFG